MFGCDFATCVNAAGPWAGEVAKMAGIGIGPDDLSIPLPVEPRLRFYISLSVLLESDIALVLCS